MRSVDLILSSVLLLLIACAPTGSVPEDPSYASDVQPLFNTSCVGCHGSGQQNGDYRLDSHTGVLGGGSDSVPNVIPGRPDSSRLFGRLDEGTMPPSGPLDSTKVHTVRNWIDRGAKDN